MERILVLAKPGKVGLYFEEQAGSASDVAARCPVAPCIVGAAALFIPVGRI